MPIKNNEYSHHPKAGWRIFYDNIDVRFKVFIFVSFFFLVIIGISSKQVTNLHYVNISDLYERPMSYESVIDKYGTIPDGFDSRLKYNEYDMVPNNIIPVWLLVSYFVFIIVYMIIDTNRDEESDFHSADHARKILSDWWDYNKSIGSVKGDIEIYEPYPQHMLRSIQASDKSFTKEWIIPAIVKEEDGTPQYFICGVNPLNLKITTFLKTSKEFSREDRCPNCGNYSNILYLDNEDYTRAREAFNR